MFYQLLHNRTVQALGSWVGLLSIPFGILTKMSPEWFGDLSWPQAILAGIAGALIVTLILSLIVAISAFAYRTIRPAALEATPPLTAEENRAAAMNLVGKAGYEIGYEWDQYKAKVAALESALAAVIADVERQQSGYAHLDTRIDQVSSREDATALILEQFARYIVGKIVLEKMAAALRWWESRNQSHSLITSHLGMQAYYKLQSDSSLTFLDGLVDTSSTRDQIEKDIAAIMGDAAYLIVKDGENFENGETKRGWHIERCKLQREKQFLDRLSVSIPGDQDLALLAKRAERR